MSVRDLLDMAKRNLLARKLRTGLTLLGVVIGCVSIILMLSFGYGISANNRRMMESFGDVKNISVTVDDSGREGAGKAQKNLTARSVQDLENIPHVVDATPVYNANVQVTYRKYQSDFLSITAMDKETYSKMGWHMKNGSLFHGNGEGEILFGSKVVDDFYDPKAPAPSDSDDMDPDEKKETPPPFEASGKTLTFSGANFNMDFGMGGPAPSSSSSDDAKTADLKVAGVIDRTKKMEYDNTAFMTIDGFETFSEKLGLPAPEKNRFDTVQVRVDDAENAEDVSHAIEDLGYKPNGMLDIIKEMDKSMSIINAIFAGIGSISFIVAAIGIANTMIMSIYERTKEIGVMKVIGASIQDIQKLFLTEAAMIGFIGGILGVTMSLLLSWGFNVLGNQFAASQGAEETIVLSYIPFWLVLVALVFSTLVGVAAGYFPAKRAMNLSALDAIRSD
ncbi:MAG: FtsX-like permease family protein [Peptoniphilus sp.]|nr:FtsX-like permease family protein [Peptoniphilus sp.]MDD7362558.1 ABC transporter permease [Bacillota bacterium]MDY6045043.1 FtsX-like permease family protein [Peptoniphilus sp.]